ncbi:MAG TPA: DinB family protein [Flavipsychrobacter sp.]|nr:DinB family protein [Flavipsychrobacter sp.]
MQYDHIVSELSRNKNVFRDLFSGLKEPQIRWSQAPGKWCLLEIICHLYDEEREDFRARVAHILNDATKEMPKIDPVAWVTERKYIEQNYDEMTAKFVAEREKSIEWLQSLQNPDWQLFYRHPKVGPVSAELIFTNWLAHDYLHVRQITRLKYDYLKAHTAVPLDYAGEW